MTATKIKKYVLLYLPYAALFWFFSKCGEAYRLTPSDDVLTKLMGSLTGLNIAMSRPLPSFDPFDMLVGLVGAAAIFLIVWQKKRNAKNWRKDIEYGSARWGNRKDIEPFIDPKPDNNIILTATESLTLASRPKNPKHARNKNVLIVGGSGSGKTRFWLKPNLMQCHTSYCVTDPKGQILVECGKLLQREKYRIKVLNTIDFAKSMHYNPLAYIRSEKDILKLVTALIANTKGEGKSGEDFWVKAETLLYCALIGYIHYEAAEHEKNLNSLVEMINSMEVHEEDETYKNAVDYLFDELEHGKPLKDEDGNLVLDRDSKPIWEVKPQENHFAVRQYAKYKLAAGGVT